MKIKKSIVLYKIIPAGPRHVVPVRFWFF